MQTCLNQNTNTMNHDLYILKPNHQLSSFHIQPPHHDHPKSTIPTKLNAAVLTYNARLCLESTVCDDADAKFFVVAPLLLSFFMRS